MKLLSSPQIHQWDAYTIVHEPITSLDLMERAAGKCTSFLLENNLAQHPIKIFCGKGNNGGDGLVIARQLFEAGYQPQVYILEFGAMGTDDFQANLHRLHQITTGIFFVQSEASFPAIEPGDVLVDALYGSGLNRPLTGLSAALVQYLNASAAIIIAIDVPSGMYTDKSCHGNAVIQATYTLTFQAVKLCFMLAENAPYVGALHVLDIGLAADYPQQVQTTYNLVTKAQVAGIIKPRSNFAHKGTYGHALLVAGNTGKMGAALLAAKACLRSGVGLATLHIPATALNIVQTALPEAMCSLRGEEVQPLTKYSTIGIGPGIGTGQDAAALVTQVLDGFAKPAIFDADALNVIAANKQWLDKIPPGSIITPHPKEFDRLFGSFANEMDRIEMAIQASLAHNIVVVLKGHHTLIAHRGCGWFNTTGNAGLAKGGSGDVLTGIITALLCQGYTGQHAAIAGVYLHGLAADLALQHQSQESLLASDVIESLGSAFYELSNVESLV